jgi:hypothetical protein
VQPIDAQWPVPEVIDSLLRAALPANLHPDAATRAHEWDGRARRRTVQERYRNAK